MRLFVRLAILVAALLLVTNMAFAAPACDERACYDVTLTDQTGAAHYEFWPVCLKDDGTGTIAGGNTLALFGGGPSAFEFGFDAHPKWTKWIIHTAILSGSIWTDIEGVFLTGEGYNSSTSMRWTVKGTKIPCP